MKSPVDLLAALIDDISSQSNNVKGLDRDYLTIVERVKNEGNSFLSITLPILDEALLQGLQDGRFACPSNFKKVRKSALPRLFSGLLRNIFDLRTGLLLDNPCITSLNDLHTILRLFKKLTLTSKNQSKLVLKAQNKYRKLEEHILESRQNRDPRRMHLLRSVASLCCNTLDFKSETFRGKHGPGSVYEKLSPNDKWRYLATSINLDDRLDLLGYTESYNDSVTQIDPLVEVRSNMSEVIAVPKNSTSVRLITVEPFLNQFIQGGLKKSLWDFISKSPLKQCLQLDHQEHNQRLALDGSRTGEWSTLDLSSASDLVDVELVDEIFSKYDEFYRILMLSRTPSAHFGNTNFVHQKFAGMGNATTFPIQSIVYAILCICAILEKSGQRPTYRRVVHIASNSIQVYGDDIIVKTEYYSSVVEWLTHFGLIVNTSKSFSKGNFRESCGVEAYSGVDITPIYVKHWPHNNSEIDPKTLCSLVSNSNSLWERCYYRAATMIQEMVEHAKGSMPLVSRKSSCLGWTTRKDAYSFSKWDKHLHRFLVRGFVPASKRRKDKLSGYAALLKFFHLPFDIKEHEYLENIREKEHLESSIRRYSMYLRPRWCTV